MDDQAGHPVGSDEWLDRVFEARVRGRLFGSHTPSPDGPVLVLLGGQPAAGKTQAQRTVLAEHPDDDLVEVAAAATPAVVSRLSAEMRSLAGGVPAVGRWTPPGAHESALEHSPGVLAALEALPHVARVQVFSRERLLYDNTRTSAGAWERPAEAARVLRTEQRRRLGEVEAVGWLRDYAAVFAQAAARPGYLGPETAPTYLRLQTDAEGVIRSLMVTPGAPVAELQGQQRERHAHLRWALPPDLMPPRRTARPAPFSEPSAQSPRREPPTRGL